MPRFALLLTALLILLILFAGCNRPREAYWDETALAMVQTADGGFLIAGQQLERFRGSSRYILDSDFAEPVPGLFLVRTDNAGRAQWSRSLDITPDNGPIEISPQADGGFAIAGFDPYTQIHGSIFVLKVDASGNEVWRHDYSDSLWNYMQICPTSDGGFGVALSSHQYPLMRVVRVDNSGNFTPSTLTLGNGDSSRVTGIVEGADGDLVIATYLSLLKISAAGDILWRRYPANGIAEHYRIARTADGGFLTTMNVWNPQTSELSVGVQRFTAEGDSAWSVICQMPALYEMTAMTVLPDGSMAALINRYASQYDARLLRLTSPSVWWLTFPSVLSDCRFQAICPATDGGMLIGGDAPIRHNSGYGVDAYVVRTDANGTNLWQYSYGK